MTTVNISATFSVSQRQHNGLDTHADLINDKRDIRVPIVGYVEFHQYTEKLTGNVLTVAIPAIEPVIESDGSDPDGRGKATMAELDALRKKRGKGEVKTISRADGELDGQEALEFDFDGDGAVEVRVGPDGPREVPPPSGEEVVAGLAERRAAKAKGKPAADPFDAKGGEA